MSGRGRRKRGRTGLIDFARNNTSVARCGAKESEIVKFNFEVGEAEKHRIECEFNQLLGRLVIKSGQQVLKRRVRWFNEPVRETELFQVDAVEPLRIRIEKQRGSLFGCKWLVYLNERLFACYEGV